MSTRLTQRVVPRATNYAIKYPMDAPGTVFTNRGATSLVTFTLPAPSRALLGVWYEFVSVVDQPVTVTSTASGQIATLNNGSANSLSASTGGQQIGARIKATCVETAPGTYQWLTTGAAVGVTYTVA